MNDFAGFSEHFGIIQDHRADRGKKHNLMDILFITLCAILSGAETFVDMEDFGDLRVDWLRSTWNCRAVSHPTTHFAEHSQ
jgi:hypothetical protein